MCLKCRVDWVSKYGKMDEKHTFWAIFGDVYRYTLNMYRYTLCSSHFGQCVSVHIKGVPVHPVLFFQFRPVFVF